jgi:5'-methylthioadenosine phosphorylase
MVLVDQFYDRTYARESTFFGGGVVAHIMFAEPVCNALRKIIYDTGKRHLPDVHIHWGGTYLNMEGPAFSTKAESNIHRSMGIDVVGMTNATEAKLAREAEICYATVSLITDYDCWIEDDPEAMVSIEMIMENQRKNIENAGTLICEAVKNIPSERTCNCPDALKTAIISDKKGIPRETLEKLRPIIGKYVSTE